MEEPIQGIHSTRTDKCGHDKKPKLSRLLAKSIVDPVDCHIHKVIFWLSAISWCGAGRRLTTTHRGHHGSRNS